jgi:hypothetical protein
MSCMRSESTEPKRRDRVGASPHLSGDHAHIRFISEQAVVGPGGVVAQLSDGHLTGHGRTVAWGIHRVHIGPWTSAQRMFKVRQPPTRWLQVYETVDFQYSGGRPDQTAEMTRASNAGAA